MQSKNVF